MDNHHPVNDALSATKRRRLWLLSGLRLLLAMLLLVSLALTLGSTSKDTNSVSPTLVATVYALAALVVIWSLTFNTFHWRGQLFAQLTLDVVVIGLLVSSLGGSGGGYALLFMMPIAAAATLLNTSNAMFVCSVCMLSLMVDGLRRHFITLQEVDWMLMGFQGLISFALMGLLRFAALRAERTEALADQAHAEASLMAELHEQHIQQESVGWLVMNAQGVVQLLNAPARSLAWQAQALLRVGSDLHHYPKLSPWLSARSQSLETDMPWPPLAFEGMPMLTQQSDALHIKASALPHWAGYTAITLELASARSARHQHLQLAAMGRLSASIAHEIRNPLAAISQAAELLQESQVIPAADRHLLTMVVSNSQRIDRIVHNLLAWSRGVRAMPNTFQPALRIPAMVQEIAVGLQLNTAQWRMVQANSVLPAVTFDKDHLYQILSNLLSNAARYASGAQGSIAIELRPRGQHVAVLICDDGAPVDSEVVRHLFEPFQTASKQGTGLGLFLCHEYAQANRGQLELMFADPSSATELRWVQAPYTKAFVLSMPVAQLTQESHA
jgi:two-component system, NtrC family, sensor histidine kinase PilS